MPLIIETGEGLPDADSYARAADLVSYAANYGATIPEAVEAQEALLRRAALQMQVMGWKGRKASAAQALAWPRRDAEVDGEILPSTYIPARIEYGQMALAVEIHADDIDPPAQRLGAVIRERVEGAVDVQYAENKSGYLMHAAPDRPSRAQFADYLVKRGLFAVRA
ncbi:DnaT-like ssDNA-binding protein [Pseudomonas sp.]|uniref:DnaT-like ssDNA-binding protein n=1 Tax=Pseudomonas sp. TaxID=306 RepID=UPI0019FA1767|nr:DnaT-like ssDNA-binding protein [Pseudomonas sp.]MBF0675586.1 hypothetical protein [Pseudomonas sp.]